MMNRPFAPLVVCLAFGVVLALPVPAVSNPYQTVDQGPDWTDVERRQFYSEDQGSRIMPIAWMRALKSSDGTPFLADGLGRYGYLANPDGDAPDLPVGFTLGDHRGVTMVGMTCAACHTRQIMVDGTAYRIDGGPAIVDFQSFLSDLDDAVGAVMSDDEIFAAFAAQVLGADHSETDAAVLRLEVELWYLRYHTLMTHALPPTPWGPSRLDAVSMIFNRLAGLDVGPPPTFLIPENIYLADAPVRYPFLWNAPRQDKTQWPGFADNGNAILGLARNLGQVIGVFAIFHPGERGPFQVLNKDYFAENSANFDGLQNLESLVWKIGPPKWPWPIDQALAAEGKAVFERSSENGGCVECHGIRTGATRALFRKTWKTPIQDVDTDAKECSLLTRLVKTGSLEGARIPVIAPDPLGETETAFDLLRMAVLGSITQNTLSFGTAAAEFDATAEEVPVTTLLPELDYLRGAFRSPPIDLTGPQNLNERPRCAYEARVLQGIWAAAPYLHNGSVPSLSELLKPAAERVAAFKVGPNYDLDTVGLAADQSQFDYTLTTTDCSEPNSGNSRCGHEYGVEQLSEHEKTALIEYLKTL